MPENHQSELDTTELIGLVEGTVKELKNYVRAQNFSDDQLQQILDAEKTSKDRKTAKRFLKQRIDDKEEDQTEKVDKDELDKEALLQMLGGTVEDVKEYVKENNPSDEKLQNLLHAEKMVKDRKTVVKFLKSYSKKKELKEDLHKAEKDLKELQTDLKTIEENVLDEDIDIELDLEEIPEPDEGQEQEDEETEESGSEEESDEEDVGEDETVNESEEPEETEEKPGDTEEQEEDAAEGSEDSEDDSEDELSDMEKKKNILEDMEMELSEEELEQISVEELESLKQEKEKREQLIEKLSVKFDRDQLEQLTTSDLEKLADEIEDSDGLSRQQAQEKEEEKKAQEEKDKEELEKEAQEDLEMMMGAVKSDSEDMEDDGSGAVDQIKQLPDKLKGMLNRGKDDEEEEETGFNKDKTIEVLEEYKGEDGREAAIKTAQVMKGYLEYALGIEREMTYAELADEMESRELDNENINTLIRFYRSMKISVYTGDVETDNIDEVIEASEAAVKELK